jgi:integrase
LSEAAKGANGKLVTDFLSPDDVFAVIAAGDAQEATFGIFRLLLYTGCRVSKAMSLRRQQVALDQMAGLYWQDTERRPVNGCSM